MRHTLPLFLGCVLLSACAAPATEKPVSVDFVLKAGERPAACGAPIDGIGGRRVQISDARLYVHDIRLTTNDGRSVPLTLAETPFQHDGIALLDFEDATGACRSTPATNTRLTGTVPPGAYSGLSFVIGVPAPANHTSATTAPAPLNLAAMGWSWQAGRKFIKIELDPEGGITRPAGRPGATWHLHLGSTGCEGDPVQGEAVTCSRPNRIPVQFPAFDPQGQNVVVDLAVLFDGTDVGRDGGGALGCMSGPDDPDCPGVFRQMGLTPPTAQPPFLRIEAKK